MRVSRHDVNDTLLNFEFAQRDSKLAKAPHHAGLCA